MKYDIIDKVINNSVFSLRYTAAPVDDRSAMIKTYVPGVALIIGDERNDVICEMTFEELAMLYNVLNDLDLINIALVCQHYFAITSTYGGVKVNPAAVYEEVVESNENIQQGLSIIHCIPGNAAHVEIEDDPLPL